MPLLKFNLSQERKHTFFLIGFCFLLCVPALYVHFPDSQDGVFALMAFKSFSQQFYAGDFYPRWLYDFYDDAGAPMFYYYPPFLFYLEVFIDSLTLRVLPDYFVIGLTATTLHITSALACYVWIKDSYGAQKAFIAAIVYSVLPNHLILDLYYKGTLTQLSAYLWLPLILLFIKKSFNDVKAIGFIAIFYALLITSSVPMALAFSPFFILYAGYTAWNEKVGIQHVPKPFIGLVLGFGLAGFHIITAYLMTDYITAASFWEGFYNPRNWFICTYICDHSPYPTMSFKISNVIWFQFLTILAMFVAAYQFAQTNKERSNYIFWLITSTGALFMMSQASIWFWDNVPLLERIQFPWRLALASELAFVVFIAAMLPIEKAKLSKATVFAMIVIYAFMIFSVRTAYVFGTRSELYSSEEFNEMVETRNYFGVYLPSFAVIDKTDVFGLDIPLVSAENASISNAKQNAHGITFDIDAFKDTKVEVHQLYFPSWQAHSVNTAQQYALTFDHSSGHILLNVPKGQNSISLSHRMLVQEKIGWAATGVSMFFLLGLFGYTRHRQKKNAR